MAAAKMITSGVGIILSTLSILSIFEGDQGAQGETGKLLILLDGANASIEGATEA